MSQQWTNTVHFAEAVERLYAAGVRTFIDLGPGDMMCGLVRDILRGRDYSAVSMLPLASPTLASGIAELYAAGLSFDRQYVAREVGIWEPAAS
jgi:malonyl CoA-acyl carrier protein transacylase